jgi:hypothetical protein
VDRKEKKMSAQKSKTHPKKKSSEETRTHTPVRGGFVGKEGGIKTLSGESVWRQALTTFEPNKRPAKERRRLEEQEEGTPKKENDESVFPRLFTQARQNAEGTGDR